MPSFTKSLPRTLATGILATSLALTGATAFADDHDEFEPEAYLYHATCADLDASTEREEIDDLSNEHDDDDSANIYSMLQLDGTPSADVWLEKDDVDDHETVQDLIDGDFAIVVHEDEDSDSAILVCGDVDGTLEDGSLLIQLNEVDGSGWEGRAYLTPDDGHENDDDDIDIAVGIYPAGSVEPVGTPAG